MRCCDKEICSREFAFDLLGWDRAAQQSGGVRASAPPPPPPSTATGCHVVEDPRAVPAPLPRANRSVQALGPYFLGFCFFLSLIN